jgi:hypothetical protein
VSVSVTDAAESGLNSQRSVRKSAPNWPWTLPAVMNHPAVVAGEYAPCAGGEARRRRTARPVVARRRRLMGNLL